MTGMNASPIQRSSALCCRSRFSSVQKHYELFISGVGPFGFVTVRKTETDPLYFLNLRRFGDVRCRRLQILYLFHLSFIPHLLMSLLLLLSLLMLLFSCHSYLYFSFKRCHFVFSDIPLNQSHYRRCHNIIFCYFNYFFKQNVFI